MLLINDLDGARSVTFGNRLRAVSQWMAAKLGRTSHEHRVARIAARLFDLTRRLHGLGRRYRRALKAGALLHDVGRCQGAGRHHITGARLILASRSLPLRSWERHVAAFLARYHRGPVPEDREWDELGRERDGMRILLGLLRAADALDSRRLSHPALAIRLRGSDLRIRCHIHGQWRRAQQAFRKRRKFTLLRLALGLRVKLQLRRVDEPAASRV